MALSRHPTEERMVSTFVTAYVCGINIVSRDRSLLVMNSSSRRYTYDTRNSNFDDFQGIFLYFPDLSQNL